MRGPERVRIRACRRDRRLLRERPAPDGQPELRGERRQELQSVGGERAPAEREDRVAAERHHLRGLVGGVGGVGPRGRLSDPRGLPAVSSNTFLSAKHRDRIHAEGRSRVLDELRKGIALGGDARGQARERLRLRAAALRLRAIPRLAVDHDAHADRDDDEHDQRNHVLGVGNLPGVDRRREEPVDQQCRYHRRRERRPQSATERDPDDRRQVQQHDRGQRHLPVECCDDDGQADEHDRAGDARDELPVAREAGRDAARDANVLRGRLVRDHVDVDRPGTADHVEDDGAAEQPSPSRPVARSHHDLRDPLRPGEVQDRVGHARPDDLLEPTADLPHELADGLEVGGVIPAGGRDDVHGDQLAAAPRGHPRRAADQGLVLRTTPHRDEDPLPRRRRLGSPCRRRPRPQLLVDTIGHPHERQLAQTREVLVAERSGQGRVHPFGRKDVPVRQPPLERLRRHVDELQLIRVPHERVGDRCRSAAPP